MEPERQAEKPPENQQATPRQPKQSAPVQQEKTVYLGGPSQVINYNTFIVCAILFVIVLSAPAIYKTFLAAQYSEFKMYYMLASKILFFVPIIWAFSVWIKVKMHKYTITTERLTEEVGVLSKNTDVLELYRVKDITFNEPFALRMFSCGNIILDTSDKSTPLVVLHAIKSPKAVIDILRQNVEIMRTKKGVREID